jgi:hypothetical protein
MPVLNQTIQCITSGDTLIISFRPQPVFLNRFDGRLLRVVTQLEEGNQYIFIRKIGQKLWLGTRNGAFMLDYPLKKEKTYLPGRSVSSVLKDREGACGSPLLKRAFFMCPTPISFSIPKPTD